MQYMGFLLSKGITAIGLCIGRDVDSGRMTYALETLTSPIITQECAL